MNDVNEVISSWKSGRRGGAAPLPGELLDCPDCKRPLEAVHTGSVEGQRCPGCRGIWLDPPSFERVCDDEERARGDAGAGTAPARAGAARSTGAPALEQRVRYRPCPACGELMNRRQFARVSGVVIDVCRLHGVWLDGGDLAGIRRFLRDGGARRLERIRALDDDPPSPAAAAPLAGPRDHLADVILGGDRFDVPSRLPLLPVAIATAAAGAWLVRSAFAPRGLGGHAFADATGLLGFGCLLLACQAFRRWFDLR